MNPPKSILTLVAVGAIAIAAAGCTTSSSGAEAPLPTIGLGFEFDSTDAPGVISGAADANVAGADRIDTIVMVGDSITRASTSELYARFGQIGLANKLIESQNSKRMAVSTSDNPSGAAVVTEITGDGSVHTGHGDSDDAVDDDRSNEVWVVALGTNDVDQYATAAEVAVAVDEVLAAVPADTPLVWVDTYIRDRSDGANLINSVVRERLSRRGNAVLAPWTSFAGTEGVLSSDGVHPSDGGKDVFAFVVADTVQAFLGR